MKLFVSADIEGCAGLAIPAEAHKQEAVYQAFAREIPGTTKIIIAQRISSVESADRIVVMEDGRVHGFGTHEQLLKDDEIYREVYESQTSGGGDFDEKAGED